MKLSCQKASALVDKKLATNLSFKEWINLKFHLSMCDICALYQKQSKLIETAIKSRLTESEINSKKNTNGLIKKIQTALIEKK